MKEYITFDKEEKLRIIEEIRNLLIKEGGVIYAYIFGSFLDPISIRDVDIGIYLKEINVQDVFDYELKLAVFVVSLNLF